ncbi:MAG: hypothetical protein ACI9R3_005180 [Verrucomicrobiales bacterium]
MIKKLFDALNKLLAGDVEFTARRLGSPEELEPLAPKTTMRIFLAALMALSGTLFFFASDAEAGRYTRHSRVSNCRPVSHAPVYRTQHAYHRPVYRAPAPQYRPVYRPAYRVQYYRSAPVRYRSYSRCR